MVVTATSAPRATSSKRIWAKPSSETPTAQLLPNARALAAIMPFPRTVASTVKLLEPTTAAHGTTRPASPLKCADFGTVRDLPPTFTVVAENGRSSEAVTAAASKDAVR